MAGNTVVPLRTGQASVNTLPATRGTQNLTMFEKSIVETSPAFMRLLQADGLPPTHEVIAAARYTHPLNSYPGISMTMKNPEGSRYWMLLLPQSAQYPIVVEYAVKPPNYPDLTLMEAASKYYDALQEVARVRQSLVPQSALGDQAYAVAAYPTVIAAGTDLFPGPRIDTYRKQVEAEISQIRQASRPRPSTPAAIDQFPQGAIGITHPVYTSSYARYQFYKFPETLATRTTMRVGVRPKTRGADYLVYEFEVQGTPSVNDAHAITSMLEELARHDIKMKDVYLDGLWSSRGFSPYFNMAPAAKDVRDYLHQKVDAIRRPHASLTPIEEIPIKLAEMSSGESYSPESHLNPGLTPFVAASAKAQRG